MNLLKKWRVALGIVLCAVIGTLVNAEASKNSSALENVDAQDVASLDRRISLLEQRLYYIESNISRLQQSIVSQRPQVLQPSARDQEIDLLRGTVQTLQLRLSEIECGLVKLDERTLTPAVRDARRNAGAKTADPCRLNPAAPLRLSNRP